MSVPQTQDQDTYAPEPEAELGRRFHEGDARAMDRIAELFFRDVRRYALAMLRDEDRAHEAVQDTFLRLVERHPLFEPGRPFRPWLFAICRNCCLTHLRIEQQARGRTTSIDDFDDLEKLAAQVPRAEERLMREECERQTLALLAPLPEAAKATVMLHLFEDLTFREIGEIMGVPAASAATTYYRTLAALRERLANDPRPMEGSKNGHR